ncbi:AAA family ATPase [Actinacidiphila acididurans]|uniref:Nuclease SbcCD subunit C n=1 Tax=Actinacidiphila acididurans TaxID=2784346 RepID=A0ABS2U1V1_9ACTN|nr:AAA family ATPase [Actinacidiphila acididurans]MBM9509574.1 AAA family ATPase [Actinacidiphila acididurans]
MRLHRLTLTAFGPFAGTQHVDFDELSAAGLFLLHGATGAGKTSVLDAVCYALYGQVPGARPATRLRSDHAEPGTATEVVLDLTVGGRRLEITRRPEQPRAKKRGTGWTMEKPVTYLREHKDGQWHGLSRSHQEIGEEVKQLVGMSCEQFCQVVLLPQGEFATFLRAGAMERARLLGRLFDTGRFKRAEGWLRDRAAEAARRLESGDRELADLAAAMRQAAGTAPAPEGGAVDDLLAEAAVLRCDAREQHTVASAALTLTERTHAAAQSDADRARDLHALQTRHADARRRAEALTAERPAREAARTRLARALRAATVESALTLHTNAAARHEAASTAAHSLLSAPALLATLRGPRPAGADEVGSAGTRVPAGHLAGGDDVRAGGAGDDMAGAVREALPGPGVGAERTATVVVPDAPGSGFGGPPGEGVRPGGPRGGEGSADGAAPVSGSGGQDGARRLPGIGDSAGTPPAAGAAASGEEPPGGATPANRTRGRDDVPRRPGTGNSTGTPAVPAQHRPNDPGSALPGPRAAAAHGEGGAVLPVGSATASVLAGRVGELREEVGGLARGAELEARVEETEQRLAGLDRQERADEEAVREAQAWLDEWPGTRTALQGRLDAAMEAVSRAAGLAAEVRDAAGRLAAAQERDRLAAETARAQDAARDARDRSATAREAWQDLREARIEHIAAELAQELADGQPCRVCGALEHPAPASPADRQVTRADEDLAYADYQRESGAYERVRETVTRLEAALTAARTAAGDTPRAELTADHAALADRHAAAEREAAGVPRARTALERAEEERDRRAALRQDVLSRAAARASRREELTERHDLARAELAEARGDWTSVAARREHLAGRIALLERALTAVREAIEAGERLAQAEAALAEAAARAGFGSPDEAAAALLPGAARAAAERQAEEWDRQEAAVAADLAAPEPAAAAQEPPARPDLALAALEEATRTLRVASAAEAAAASRVRELDRLGATATARVRDLAPAREAAARLKRLSDLVAANSAENTYRMELETYVLAARLEQVAAAAGVRLLRMSGGRYTLVHTDARADRRAKSGLGLMVVDAWTGTERDTATLSGGETFFASLALALGLADVVTDEAGGTRLDTLFIDEGFGSLDDQTLDEVLDVLDGLRERDRAVGIVSHVADLRHRIPAQLRVTKGRDGSTLQLRAPALA